jgi:hypothetical protein
MYICREMGKTENYSAYHINYQFYYNISVFFLVFSFSLSETSFSENELPTLIIYYIFTYLSNPNISIK